MRVLSNREFLSLVAERSNQLKSIASKRCELEPAGCLEDFELDNIIATCQYAGNSGDVKWLKSLKAMHTSGKLHEIKSGKNDFWDHALEVRRLVAQKTIPFDMNDFVIVNESGRSGTVADYNVDTKEYVVVLSPFQVATFKPEELTRGKVP